MTLRLTSRIVLSFVLLAATLLVVAGVLSYRSGSASLRAAAASEMRAVVNEKAMAVAGFLSSRLREVDQLARAADLTERVSALVATGRDAAEVRVLNGLILQEFASLVSGAGAAFAEMSVIDAQDGVVLVSTTPTEVGKSKARSPYLAQGMKRTFLLGPYNSVALKEPAMIVAAPVRSADGHLLAVLTGRLRIEALEAIAHRRSGAHKSDDAFLVNGNGQIASQPRLAGQPLVLRQKVPGDIVARCIAGASASELSTDHRGVAVIRACHWIADYQLGVVAKVDQAEAFAPVLALRRSMAEFGGLAIVLSVGLALLLARGITRPLREMSNRVKEFAQGQIIQPLPDSSGDELGLLAREFNAMAQAIGTKETELRHVAEELDERVRQRTAELARAQEVAGVGSWEWDEARNGMTWSDQMFDIFGLDAAECLPSYERYLASVHPEDRSRTIEWMNVVLTTQTRSSLDIRIVRPSGEERAVRGYADVVLNAAGDVTSVVGTSQDVTESVRVDEELRKAKVAAEAASMAKSEFLATMSHEIRTPMNGVIGAVGLLLDGGLTPRQRELAGIAHSSAHSLLDIINEILDLSKIEAGKVVIERAPFDALATVEDVVRMFAWRADEKRLDLVLRYAPDAGRRFVGDACRIRQVLVNLVGNAIKFCDRGHVLVSIEEEGSTRGQAMTMLRVTVEDTGIGIAPEAVGRLFERFMQADASTTRRFGGTGLGLAICSRLVRLMGGEIGVNSRVGEGSTFWFTLPLAADASAARVPRAEDMSTTRVLIVDDCAANCRVMGEQMLSWSVRNSAAASGHEALVALRAASAAGDPYHVVVLDETLPDTGGVGLARAINGDPSLGRPALILMAAARGQELDEPTRAAGVVGCLAKPVRPSALVDALVATRGGSRGRLDSSGGASRADATPSPARPRFRGRVLVADDNVTNQRVAQMALESLGCSVDLASDGAMALATLEQRTYDLVFMDCEMPEMDGMEAAGRIRAMEARVAEGGSAARHARTPIVAMTAKTLSGDRERCLAAGMDDYLTKPVHLEALIEMLARWLPAEAGDVHAGGPSIPEPPRPDRVETANEPGAVEVLNRTILERLRALAQATSPALFAQVVDAFLADASVHVAALQDAAARHERERLGRTAHALRGASLNIGATGMARVTQQLEAGTGGWEAVPPLLAELEMGLERVRAEIELELGREQVLENTDR